MRRNLVTTFESYCREVVDTKQCKEKDTVLMTYVECSKEIRENVMTYMYHLTHNTKVRGKLNEIALEHLDRFRMKFFSEN